MLNLLAGADPRTGRAPTQVAAGLQPGYRALEALPVVLIGRGELGGQVGKLEFLLVDLLAPTDQFRGDRLAGSRRSLPGLNLHDQSVRTSVWTVNKIGRLIFDSMKTRCAESIPCDYPAPGAPLVSQARPNCLFPVFAGREPTNRECACPCP